MEKMTFSAKQPMITLSNRKALVLLNEKVNNIPSMDVDGNLTKESMPEYSYDGVWIEDVLSERDVLPCVRKYVENLVKVYDASSSINKFTLVDGEKKYEYWLDKDDRIGLAHSVATWKASGKKTYQFDLREFGTTVDVDCDKFLSFLTVLENYAVECHNKTTEHLNDVLALSDIAELLTYDYKTGYPEALTFIK